MDAVRNSAGVYDPSMPLYNTSNQWGIVKTESFNKENNGPDAGSWKAIGKVPKYTPVTIKFYNTDQSTEYTPETPPAGKYYISV